ncbi:MAG: HdeD family acid-resistance protein [Actinomycetia bacterium]|nr:HdeD family acid-resistance protein [Actinomycetes bacterium]
MAMSENQTLWRWNLVGGIVSIIVGIVVLAWPGRTLLVLAVLFGIQLILMGLTLIVTRALVSESAGRLVLGIIGGVLAILLGLATFRAPGRTLALLALFLGAAWLVSGLMETIEGIVDQTMENRGWHIIVGGITTLAGIVVMSAPLESLLALAVWGGVLMIILGAVRCAGAFQLRRLAEA